MEKNISDPPLLKEKEFIPEIPTDFINHQQLPFGISPNINELTTKEKPKLSPKIEVPSNN